MAGDSRDLRRTAAENSGHAINSAHRRPIRPIESLLLRRGRSPWSPDAPSNAPPSCRPKPLRSPLGSVTSGGFTTCPSASSSPASERVLFTSQKHAVFSAFPPITSAFCITGTCYAAWSVAVRGRPSQGSRRGRTVLASNEAVRCTGGDRRRAQTRQPTNKPCRLCSSSEMKRKNALRQ